MNRSLKANLQRILSVTPDLCVRDWCWTYWPEPAAGTDPQLLEGRRPRGRREQDAEVSTPVSGDWTYNWNVFGW